MTISLYSLARRLLKLASVGRRERERMGIAKTHLARPVIKTLSPTLRAVSRAYFVSNAAVRTFGATIAFVVAGCAVLDTHQAKLDQKQLREVLMDYDEDQILDNLIRAYNGLPVVQFDVKTVTAQVASKISPSVTAGRTGGSNRYPGNSIASKTTTDAMGRVTTEVTKTIGSVASAVGTVMRPFSSTIGAERSNNVQVEVKPMDEVKIYAAYVRFLNADQTKIPVVSEEPNALELNKVTTTTTEPTSVTKTTKTSPTPSPSASPSSELAAATTTETMQIDRTISIRTEELGKEKSKKDVGEDLVVKAHSNSPTQGIRPLMQTDTAPSRTDVLVGPKRWRDRYYWVPVHYRKAFFELCLATVTKGATTGVTSTQAIAEPSKTQKANEELKDELEDLNTLQRLNSTPLP